MALPKGDARSLMKQDQMPRPFWSPHCEVFHNQKQLRNTWKEEWNDEGDGGRTRELKNKNTFQLLHRLAGILTVHTRLRAVARSRSASVHELPASNRISLASAASWRISSYPSKRTSLVTSRRPARFASGSTIAKYEWGLRQLPAG